MLPATGIVGELAAALLSPQLARGASRRGGRGGRDRVGGIGLAHMSMNRRVFTALI